MTEPIVIYLGGVIRPEKTVDGEPHGIYEHDLDWRLYLEQRAKHEDWFTTLNPLDGFYDNGKVRWNASPDEIVTTCTRMVAECNAALFNLLSNGRPVQSIGSVCEMWYANTKLKLVVPIADTAHYFDNPWLRYCAAH